MVNSNLKRSEHELSELNSMLADINKDAKFVAPRLRITLSQGAKKSPSPIRQRLLKGVPKVFLGGGAALLGPEEGRGLAVSIPEACPEGQSPGNSEKGQGSGLSIPEALPGTSEA